MQMARKESYRLALQVIVSIALISAMLALYIENTATNKCVQMNAFFSDFVIFLIFFLISREKKPEF